MSSSRVATVAPATRARLTVGFVGRDGGVGCAATTAQLTVTADGGELFADSG